MHLNVLLLAVIAVHVALCVRMSFEWHHHVTVLAFWLKPFDLQSKLILLSLNLILLINESLLHFIDAVMLICFVSWNFLLAKFAF